MSEHDPQSWPPPPGASGPPPGQGVPQPPPGYVPPPAYGGPGMPAPMASAQSPQLPPYPHPEPRPYHLLLRTWNYRWWKPVVGILVLVVTMILVAPVVLLPVLALGVWAEGGDFLDKFQKAATLQTVDPAALLYLNLVLGSMTLVCWGIVRVVHRMRPRWLMSVRPKIRWRLFWACVPAAVVALGLQLALAPLLPGADEGGSQGLNHFTLSSLAIAIIVVFTTPLQAMGEEYVFRGYIMQAVGALIGVHESRVGQACAKYGAVLATAVTFAFAHGAQNFPLFFDRFMFGFIAALLVIRTGGLEAGIAMHVLNNFLAFGAALAFGDLTSTLTVSHVSWWNIVLTLVQSGSYYGLVLVIARRLGVENTTVDRRRDPVPAAEGAVATA
jgi:membrane protease YdiL (CAAX protease family)